MTALDTDPCEPLALSARIRQQLLDEVLAGAYGAEGRLPAERELAARFGASRVTIREALQALERAGVVDVRRGSGAVVRPRREWSVQVLPAYARAILARGDPALSGTLVRELLTLRRDLIGAAVGRAAGRLRPGELDPARAAVAEAWAHRDDPGAFVRLDVDVARRLLDAAGLLVPLWLLNDALEVYIEAAEALVWMAAVPDNYVERQEALFQALERGDREGALAAVATNLDEHDQAVLAAIGG
ncbi:MAG: FadR family transcriptional regulator [Myxococcales bacterium]|nr:FadR family transcriptional regulator [Myxococcales bacterium]